MKILECPTDNKTRESRCSCGCVFEYTADDIERDTFDDYYVICPICSHRIEADETLLGGPTVDDFNFQKECYTFGGNDSFHLTDSEVQKWLESMLDDLSTNESNCSTAPFCIRATGDSIVIAIKWEDEYQLIHARNYSELSIQR